MDLQAPTTAWRSDASTCVTTPARIRSWEASSYPIPYPSQIVAHPPYATLSTENSVKLSAIPMLLVPSLHEVSPTGRLFDEIGLSRGPTTRFIPLHEILLLSTVLRASIPLSCVVFRLRERAVHYLRQLQLSHTFASHRIEYIKLRLALYQQGEIAIIHSRTRLPLVLRHFQVWEESEVVILTFGQVLQYTQLTAVWMHINDLLLSGTSHGLTFSMLFDQDIHGAVEE